MVPRLHVNIDHVATVRQARRAAQPDPVAWALAAERAGAHGITCHLRKDRRHVQDDDVSRLRAGDREETQRVGDQHDADAGRGLVGAEGGCQAA